MGKKKLTLEEVKERLGKINRNIEILSEEYINNKTKLKCKCLVDGHEWYINWSNLSSGYGCPQCACNIKLNIEDIKIKLHEINPNIQILDDEYINSRTEIGCKCLIDGCEWDARWDNLNQGQGCPKCGKISMIKKQSLTLEQIIKKLKHINQNIEILSDKYKNNRTKLKCKCLIDGHEWEAVWSSLQQGQGCPKCAGNIKFTIEYIKNKLNEINPNIKILNSTYLNSTAKLKCRCEIDGYEWVATWNSLNIGSGCPKCAKVLKLDIVEIKNRLMEINPKIKILSDKYINNHTSIQCICLIDGCGHKWNSIWVNLYRGRGCPKCASTGVHNKKLAERNKDIWLKINTIVYLIECKNENELFYKIGITKNKIDRRFDYGRIIPYEYTLINEIKTNLYDAVYLESKLHKLNKEFSYKPQIKFAGYTECFSEIKIFENVL